MSYTVKYTDEDGVGWFLRHRGMWSDSYRDAWQFETEAEADAEASSAANRLNARPDHNRARVRVIKTRKPC